GKAACPEHKDEHRQPRGGHGCRAEGDQIDAAKFERRGEQPHVERRFRVVVVELPVEGRPDPVAASDHFERARRVQGLVPLRDGLTAETEAEVERGERQDERRSYREAKAGRQSHGWPADFTYVYLRRFT